MSVGGATSGASAGSVQQPVETKTIKQVLIDKEHGQVSEKTVKLQTLINGPDVHTLQDVQKKLQQSLQDGETSLKVLSAVIKMIETGKIEKSNDPIIKTAIKVLECWQKEQSKKLSKEEKKEALLQTVRPLHADAEASVAQLTILSMKATSEQAASLCKSSIETPPSTPANYDTLGADFERHLAGGNTVSIDGKKLKDPTITPRKPGETSTPEKDAAFVRSDRFTQMLDIFAEKLHPDNPAAAAALKDNWKDEKNPFKQCQNVEDFRRESVKFFKDLSASKVGGEDGPKIARLLRGLDQKLYTASSSPVSFNVKVAIHQTESLSAAIVEVKDSLQINYNFAVGEGGKPTVTIETATRRINGDHKKPEGATTGKAMESYPTQCKYELTVKSKFTSELADLEHWDTNVSVAVGTPSGETPPAEVNQCLKIGGFNPTSYTCAKDVTAKAR